MSDCRTEIEALHTIGLIVDDTTQPDEEKVADIADVLVKVDAQREAKHRLSIDEAHARLATWGGIHE
ncbi:MAG: hypothetical protein ACRDMV_19560 [Streptosporangiales bacterium]